MNTRPRTIVITGATSGIGEVAALQLAEHGARIVFVARDAARAQALLARLRSVNPHSEHSWHLADLSHIEAMRRVGDEIAARESQIDVLINNAGAVFMRPVRRLDGLAASFATNHLAYHVVTLRLLDRLLSTAGARIICTSSRAHRFARLDFEHLQYDGIRGYALSKLCNLLFVRRLSQLLVSRDISVNALHPGFVATRFADNSGFFWRTLMQWRKAAHGRTPEEGARTIVYLAEAPEIASKSGLYFVDCLPTEPSAAARSDADALRLWELSSRLTGVYFPESLARAR
ncbi:MAG: SDR family NAD(P)-dependent oxidoreductase [Steroidobacteraceae bacterium]